jgi:hypothetical protein
MTFAQEVEPKFVLRAFHITKQTYITSIDDPEYYTRSCRPMVVSE